MHLPSKSEVEALVARDQRLIDSAIEEFGEIAYRFHGWDFHAPLGIRGFFTVSAGKNRKWPLRDDHGEPIYFCPWSAIAFARTGFRHRYDNQTLWTMLDGEMKLGPVSLKLVQAVDAPFASENRELAGRIAEACGMTPRAA